MAAAARRLRREYLSLAIMLGTVLVVLDPYEQGRFVLFGPYGVPQFGQDRLLMAVPFSREDR